MSEPYFERLTQLDNSFLISEDTLPTAAMHVATTQIHEAAPLRLADGSLDIERIEDYVSSRLDAIPRYRQVLAHTPIEGHPVWVDDPNFNIHYHVRHTRLSRPGSIRQLKRLVGRIFSQRLDRHKPLWECWVIEGLEDDRIAMVSKTHHCMVDGVSGAELLAALLTTTPQEKPGPVSVWRPRPHPTTFELGTAEVMRYARAPFDAAAALTRLARDDRGARAGASERLAALRQALGDLTGGATPTPFNQPVGPHRRVDWMPMSIAEIKEIRQAVGGTLNDVVLATAAGGFARFLSRERGVDMREFDFRVMAPVNMRRPDEDRNPGNRVSSWTVKLPVDEPDPLERLARVSEQTEKLKASNSASGAELISQATEWTGSGVLSLLVRLSSQTTPVNSVITNVPGPQLPLYLLDSKLLEIHPHVPLMGTVGIGIALFSYDGALSWGFMSDWDLVPDLHDLVDATQHSFEELKRAALGATT
jgi:WS/DGAT/MGAT family acyltransferase